MGKTKQILKGKFPQKALTLDQQVETVNKATGHILEAFLEEDQAKVDRQVNNLALWLGGLHPDIQVYAFQVILMAHKLSFEADDKTEARMARLEDRIYASTGYIQYTYDQINHYPWPVEFLDGTTFEDRLEDLVKEVQEELDLDKVTVDMILQGTAPMKEVPVDWGYALSNACLSDLKEREPGDVYYERFNRLIEWLEVQSPEIGIMTMRNALTVVKLKVDIKKMPAMKSFTTLYANMLRQ